jgi:hypothetical protein
MMQTWIILKFAVVLSLSLFSNSAKASEDKNNWSWHDVSIILPLPNHLSGDPLIRPNSNGLPEEVIPRDSLETLSRLAPLLDLEELYKSLRVIGVQIEPCYSSLCRSRIHLVWQSLKEHELGNGLKEVLAEPALVHTFYEIPQDEFRTFVRGLKQLKANHPILLEKPTFGPHPLVLKQGLEGAFWQEFRQIVLAFTGPNPVSRFYTARLSPKLGTWLFDSFEFVSKTCTLRIKDPDFNDSTQPSDFWYLGNQLSVSPKALQKSIAAAKQLHQDD